MTNRQIIYLHNTKIDVSVIVYSSAGFDHFICNRLNCVQFLILSRRLNICLIDFMLYI